MSSRARIPGSCTHILKNLDALAHTFPRWGKHFQLKGGWGGLYSGKSPVILF
jgi:hypothetical protein